MTTINPLLEIIERVKGLILEEESKIDKKDWSGVIHYLCSEKYPILLNSGSQILTNEGAEDQIQAHTHTLLQGLIATLQEQQFTIIVTLLLAIQSENLPSQCTFAFIAQTKSLFSKLNIEQLQAVHKKAIKVCEHLLKVCTSSSSARSIVGSLQLASQALQIRDGVLHSTHAHFLQACVTGELYDVGNRFFVEHSVLEIDPNNSHLTPFAYMCYFYYGGLCALAMNDNVLALDRFAAVLSAPAQCMSAIAVAALKKWRLLHIVEMLTSGEISKYWSSPVQRFAAEEMSLHDSIDKSFRDSDAKKLTEVLIRGEPELRTAKDWGLASQLIDCLSKRRIVDISNSYSNLPLIKLATLLGSSISNGDLESMLVDIFVRNIIHGRIDSVKGVVYFDSGTSLSGVADDKKESLLKKIKEIECLSDRLREMKAHVLASPAYLLKQRSIKTENYDFFRRTATNTNMARAK